jgi:hypothetical protein
VYTVDHGATESPWTYARFHFKPLSFQWKRVFLLTEAQCVCISHFSTLMSNSLLPAELPAYSVVFLRFKKVEASAFVRIPLTITRGDTTHSSFSLSSIGIRALLGKGGSTSPQVAHAHQHQAKPQASKKKKTSRDPDASSALATSFARVYMYKRTKNNMIDCLARKK